MPIFSRLDRALALLVSTAACAAFGPAPCAQAQPFDETAADPVASELTCMQQAIAYEAGYEPLSGKQAVAEVILNRTHSPRFPSSVCGVVYQGSNRSTGCQFTFTCDGSLHRHLPDWVMAEAREVASAALDQKIPQQVNGAVNYHADYVLPYWAASMVRVTKIGRHIFYRPPGVLETSALERGRYTQTAYNAPSSATARPATGFSLWGLAQPSPNPQ